MKFKKQVEVKLKELKEQLEKEEPTINTGVVRLVEFNEELGTDILLLDLDGVECIIKKEDVEKNFKPKSLVNHVGREVLFVVTSIDEDKNRVYGSIAKAQELLEPITIKRLQNGESFAGTITNILPYGAYLEFEGVSGLLKNVDYAEDLTTIEDMHNIGDTIDVKLSKISSNGNLVLEATRKYVSPTAIELEDLREEQVLLGVVRNVQPNGTSFVQIARGLDALAFPTHLPIEEDQRVQFKIISAEHDERKIRGKILKIINN